MAIMGSTRSTWMTCLGAIVLVLPLGCESGVSPSRREASAEERRLARIEERLNAIDPPTHPGGASGPRTTDTAVLSELRQAMRSIESRLDALEQRLVERGSNRDIQAATPDWRPDRRPGLVFDCAGDAPTAANPFGLIEDQWRSAAASRDFLRRRYEQADRFHQRVGFVRVIWRRPGGAMGADPGGGLAGLSALDGRQLVSGTWVDKHPWRRRIFLDEAARFVNEHPGATVGVAMGAMIPASWQSIDASSAAPLEPFDPGNARHQRLAIDQVARPLAASGIHELWLEHADAPGHREAALALAQAIREATPLHVVVVSPAGATPTAPDADDVSHAPLAYPSGALLLPDGWTSDSRAEVNVLVSAATTEAVQGWLSRGVTPFALDETTWQVILDAIGP